MRCIQRIPNTEWGEAIDKKIKKYFYEGIFIKIKKLN